MSADLRTWNLKLFFSPGHITPTEHIEIGFVLAMGCAEVTDGMGGAGIGLCYGVGAAITKEEARGVNEMNQLFPSVQPLTLSQQVAEFNQVMQYTLAGCYKTS